MNTTPILQFGLATDTHYADRPSVGIRAYGAGLDRMATFVAEMNAQQVDFVAHLGDFKDEEEIPHPATTRQFLQDIEQVFAQFDGPRYHVIGNHDVDSIDKATFLSLVDNSGIEPSRSYYSFDVKGVHVVVLDGNFDLDGQDHTGDFDWQQAYMPDTELGWLQEDLTQTNLPTIVFCHQLLFAGKRHEPDKDYTYHLHNAESVRNILEQSQRVLAVFMGHIHQEMYHTINGIHYCVLPGMSDGLEADANAFALVSILENHTINVTGYGRVEGTYLPALKSFD